jgi:hypothetical protein
MPSFESNELPTGVQARAEKRTALLIGNKDYKAGVGSLLTPSTTFGRR